MKQRSLMVVLLEISVSFMHLTALDWFINSFATDVAERSAYRCIAMDVCRREFACVVFQNVACFNWIFCSPFDSPLGIILQ